MKPLDEATDELVTELFQFTLPSNSTPLQEKIKKAITAARIAGAKAMQVRCVKLCLIEHEDPGDTIDSVLDRLGDAIASIDPATVGGT